MNLLFKLTPAEAMLLINRKADLRDLLQITIVDLLIEQVLATEEIEKQISSQSKPKLLTYVKRGPRFVDYQPRNHERVFLSPFKQETVESILYSNLVNMATNAAANAMQFKRRLITGDILSSYFSQNWWQQMFGVYSLTDSGKRLREELQQEIQALDSQIQASKSQGDALREISKKIGGNIALSSIKGKTMLKSLAYANEPRTKYAGNGPDFITWLALTESTGDLAHTSESFDGTDWD